MNNPYIATIDNWVEVYKQRFINTIEYDQEQGTKSHWEYSKFEIDGIGLISHSWFAPNSLIFNSYVKKFSVSALEKTVEVSFFIPLIFRESNFNNLHDKIIPPPLEPYIDYLKLNGIDSVSSSLTQWNPFDPDKEGSVMVTFTKKVVNEHKVNDDINIREFLNIIISVFEEMYQKERTRIMAM